MKNLSSLLRLPKRRPFGDRLSLTRFAHDETATVVAEAVIVLPLFIWAYIALYVYWDAFRSMNTVQKATYTVSDMISREQSKTGITTAYITGMKQVMEYLIDHDQSVKMRVTSVSWSDTNKRFEVHWSRSPDNAMTPLTTDTLQHYAGHIPKMSAGDYVVVVEVDVVYEPAFDVGLPQQTFHQFIVTRPRFLTCIALDNIPCPL